MKKKIFSLLIGAAIVTGFAGVKQVQAKNFGMSLAPNCNWRYLTNADDCKDSKDGTGNQGYIQLGRICDDVSYYVNAKAVNSNGLDRSQVTTCKQYQRATIYEKNMQRGNWYYLALKNTTKTSPYIWTSGQFGWY